MNVAEILTGKDSNEQDQIFINQKEVPYQLLVRLNIHTVYFKNTYDEEKKIAITIMTFADNSEIHLIIK